MTSSSRFMPQIHRRTLLAGAGSAALAALAGRARAQDAVSGELVVLNWIGGSEAEMMKTIQNGFVKKYPSVRIREVNITGQGDMRGGIRTALLGGEVVDVLINTWPAFRKELSDAGMLRPIDDQWKSFGWDKLISQSWKDLGSINGAAYGLTYTFGDRSGIWYKKEHLAKAGITAPPKTWDEFLSTFSKLTEAGYAAPVAIPGKYWAHAEWFENLLLRTAGVETATKLAAHEIPWTDPAVKTALSKYAEMLSAGCCGATNTMLANDWDGEADQIFQANAKNYLLIGMWMNNRAKNDYKLVEGTDYDLFQFPSLGMGHDDTSSVDAKEFLVTSNGANPKAADAFLDYWTSAEAANLLAKNGYASPSSQVDSALYGEAQKTATAAVASSKLQFVLGDLLPGDLVDEYRVQLQKFLQDPSEANIDTVLGSIETKAQGSY
ncbi:ABC transporter substrate-binding protein [Rhizobium ruizarguesonis]|uniref:ABC transporter substrate-binding protein n=1 Tax=Rhizobium ruizarguesonis TaxID=2081791 RepID=UPI00041A4D8A|nr:extracellular solute-binding protein [Rhizobium ruizarguesonis]MBY5848543.1 extracellular solute-binding protein [Rhizobium leguminosarum]NKL31897.1 extracellular solute-binding protein [Rhizobium leguminosarum bv. viciae]MBY5884291.1 extracellular solute-binding protein [Rhizobium leguminosarum]NEH32934.1 extracellular solute-binding protein [Rhizobium ruizarguesonis]NEH88814.1 extracellular solute-binding protein [Rhizobium ruizarguesonis]